MERREKRRRCLIRLDVAVLVHGGEMGKVRVVSTQLWSRILIRQKSHQWSCHPFPKPVKGLNFPNAQNLGSCVRFGHQRKIQWNKFFEIKCSISCSCRSTTFKRGRIFKKIESFVDHFLRSTKNISKKTRKAKNLTSTATESKSCWALYWKFDEKKKQKCFNYKKRNLVASKLNQYYLLSRFANIPYLRPDSSTKDNSADLKFRQFSQKYADNSANNSDRGSRANVLRACLQMVGLYSKFRAIYGSNCLRLNCLYIFGWIVWISNRLNCLWLSCLNLNCLWLNCLWPNCLCAVRTFFWNSAPSPSRKS